MIRITLFRSYWPTNMGNAFIDLGSFQSLKAASPDSLISPVSGFPRILFETRFPSVRDKMLEKVSNIQYPPGMALVGKKLLGYHITRRIESKILKKDCIPKNNKSLENCFDLGSTIKTDYAVFSGMILYDNFIKRYRSTILDLKKKNVKIILSGVGGDNYSEGEIVRVRKFLDEIKPYAFISRDKKTFESYQDLAEYSYDGIDCAFFVNDYFAPVELELSEYVILNFDYQPEPEFNVINKMVIRIHHRSSDVWEKIPRRYFTKPNTLISDSPEDYLTLYSNTSATFSDRVHACVTTLSFGRPSKLFLKTPRALLFNKIGANTIVNKLTYPNTGKIAKEKEKQVKFLSDLLVHT